ncbi:TetR/AcrR family transcriptional regulator [candidate division KSB1 bacterium]
MPKMPEEYIDIRKKQILNAALECFTEMGYERTTVRDIAKTMDVSTGVIYNYYKGKDDILKGIYELSLDNNANLFNTIEQKNTFKEYIIAYFENVTGCCTDQEIRKSFKGNINFWAESLKNDKLNEMVVSSCNMFERKISEFVAKAKLNEEIDPGLDPEKYAMFFNALITGLQVRYVMNKDLDFSEICRDTINIITNNLWRK